MFKTFASLVVCTAMVGFMAPVQAHAEFAPADTIVLGEGCPAGGGCEGGKKKDAPKTSQITNGKGCDQCEGGKKKKEDDKAV